jgi:hypothetical protein
VVLVPALGGEALGDGAGAFWAGDVTERDLAGPRRVRLWAECGLAAGAQLCLVVRFESPRAGGCLVAGLAGIQAVVVVFADGAVAVAVVVGAPVAAGAVVAVVVDAGVVVVVAVVVGFVETVETGAGVVVGLVVVSVGADVCWVVVTVVVPPGGPAFGDCAARAEVAPPSQAFIAPDIASVLARSDSRALQPARELWRRCLRCIQVTFEPSPEHRP